MTFDEWCSRLQVTLSDKEKTLYRQAYLAGYAACVENVRRFERKLARAQMQQQREEVDYDV